MKRERGQPKNRLAAMIIVSRIDAVLSIRKFTSQQEDEVCGASGQVRGPGLVSLQ